MQQRLIASTRPRGVVAKGAQLCRVFGSHPPELLEGPAMRPRVVAQLTEFNRAVLQRCPKLKEDYSKPFILWNSHVETIWAAYFRTDPKLEYKREYLYTPDGGLVTLDTLEEGNALPSDAPVMLLIAGLSGGSSSRYVQHAMQTAQAAGFRAVALNCRGMAKTPVLTAQFYSASYTEDVRLVLKHLREEYPQSLLCALGWSLGANILVNYLGEDGDATPLSAAASLCNPFDLTGCDKNLKSGFAQFYDWNLASSMKENFKPHLHLFEGYDVEKAMLASTVRDVDDVITRVTFGWSSVDAYYSGSSSADRIKDVSIPLLCIQAEDDPICLADYIPHDSIEENENCVLVMTPYGGHLGWVTSTEGLFGPPWTNAAVLEWFSAVLQQISRDSSAYKDITMETAHVHCDH